MHEGKYRVMTDDQIFRILIAEDEEINYIFIKEMYLSILTENIQLIHARNGQEAVDIVKNDNNIDLILMDIKMPIMNGLDATRLIKEINVNLPIFVQSAYASDSDIKIAFESGCNEYLAKPIDADKLAQLTLKYIYKN